MDTERNLLFGVLAVKMQRIEPPQLAQAYRTSLENPDRSVADVLLQSGWLTPKDNQEIGDRAARELAAHGDDVRATLRAVDPEVWRSLTDLNDPSIDGTIASLDLPPAVESPTANARLRQMFTAPATAVVAVPGERYRRLHKHAAGGIGQIWVARDCHLERDVALKELRPETVQHPDLRSRFIAEARITGQLEHPGIVPVYELVQDGADGEPYYVMRFVKGRTLSADIQAYHDLRRAGKAGTLELNALLNAFVAVCQAVAYAHARGIIHRDLKGANVILGDFGEVMVLDWGLAKKIGSEETLATTDASTAASADVTLKGQVLGTPAYMAPEQAAGAVETVDHRADIYGLGAILYEILTGRPPFSSSVTIAGRETRQLVDIHELLRRIREEELPRPRQLRTDIPPALEAVCLRALAKKPQERYASAAALAKDVERWLADEPVEVYREPLRTRAGRWARRHKPVVAGAAVLLVAAVVALTISTILIGREQTRTQEMAVKADENFRAARDVVDRFFVKIGKERLLNEPGLQPLRQELLQMAADYYKKFEQAHAGDPALKADLAQALFHLAQVTSDLGDNREAAAIIDRATRLYAELTREKPGQPAYQRELARCFNRHGAYSFREGQLAEAEAGFQQARERLLDYKKTNPGDAEALETLGFTQGNLGIIYQRQKKTKEAEKNLEQSLQTFEELAGKDRANPEFQHDLAAGHTNLAKFYIEATRQPDRAEPHFKKALDIHEAVAASHPKVIEYQRGLAKSLMNLGRFYEADPKAGPLLERALQVRRQIAEANPRVSIYQNEMGEGLLTLALYLDRQRQGPGVDRSMYREHTARAEKTLAEARGLFRGLTKEFPADASFAENLGRACVLEADLRFADNPAAARPLYEEGLRRLESLKPGGSRIARLTLRNACWGLAEIEESAGKLDSALTYWRNAREFDDGPKRVVFQGKIAGIALQLAKKGDSLKAAATADEVAKDQALLGGLLMNLALTYERCAQLRVDTDAKAAASYADRAITMLQRAAERGFPDRAAALKHVEALAAIPLFAERSGFGKLLERLRAKQ